MIVVLPRRVLRHNRAWRKSRRRLCCDMAFSIGLRLLHRLCSAAIKYRLCKVTVNIQGRIYNTCACIFLISPSFPSVLSPVHWILLTQNDIFSQSRPIFHPNCFHVLLAISFRYREATNIWITMFDQDTIESIFGRLEFFFGEYVCSNNSVGIEVCHGHGGALSCAFNSASKCATVGHYLVSVQFRMLTTFGLTELTFISTF